MTFAKVVLLVVVALVGANAAAVTTDRQPQIPDVDYYDCGGRTETLEVHPWDCTRFIKCDNGRAHDFSCASCEGLEGADGTTCPDGWLHFDPKQERCDWATIAGCAAVSPTGSPVEPTNAPVEPTNAPVEPTNAPVDPADPRCPENCEYHSVDCECGQYYQCQNGQYTNYTCPAGLHFNPVTLQCDTAENAKCDLDVQKCCKCEYIGVDACGPNYIFQDHDRSVPSYEGDRHCIRDRRSCAGGLVWNANANGADKDGACDLRSNVAAC